MDDELMFLFSGVYSAVQCFTVFSILRNMFSVYV